MYFQNIINFSAIEDLRVYMHTIGFYNEVLYSISKELKFSLVKLFYFKTDVLATLQ